MVVQYSDFIIDKFIPPGVSAFDHADIPDLSSVVPQSSQWVANYFLNSAFRSNWPSPLGAFVYNFLRRAEAGFREHANARSATLRFLELNTPSSSQYALALFHWEIFLGQSWHAYALLVRAVTTGDRVFEPKAASVEKRLNQLYNDMKHVESRIEEGKIPEGATVPVWLTNEGLKSVRTHLSFAETGEILKDLAKWADALDDPRSAGERVNALLS